MDSLMSFSKADVVTSVIYAWMFSIFFSFLIALFRSLVFAPLERKEV